VIRSLKRCSGQTRQLKQASVIVACKLRDEMLRLPFFLRYYRDLGVEAFVMIDNGSVDGSFEYLSQQDDVVLYRCDLDSIAQMKHDIDPIGVALNWIVTVVPELWGKWICHVDADELLIFQASGERPDIKDFVRKKENEGLGNAGALMLDFYSKEALADLDYQAGDPFWETCDWFDAFTTISGDIRKSTGLALAGGMRRRVFDFDPAEWRPCLNKCPLLLPGFKNQFCSCHTIYTLQREPYPELILMHFKFFQDFEDKNKAAAGYQDIPEGNTEYATYEEKLPEAPSFWSKEYSRHYTGPEDLAPVFEALKNLPRK
jgi:hypothetical protein